MLRTSKLFLALVVTAPLTSGRVSAQPEPTLEPTFGSVTLASGFTPDPFKKTLKAGGQLSTRLGGVNAHVARAPDFRLDYTKGAAVLTFAVETNGETTLLIHRPDGQWVANADGCKGQIRFEKPQSGRYDIYVGAIDKDTIPATLVITEKKLDPLVGRGDLPDCYVLTVGILNFFEHKANRLNGCLNDAREVAATFKAQKGTSFRRVESATLLDQAAIRGDILGGFQSFAKKGSPGDFMVLHLSSHGAVSKEDRIWHLIPYDYRGDVSTGLTEDEILNVADHLVKQKKNVIIIVDACFCGALGARAVPYLQRYKNLKEGGMVLMLSSSAMQESADMGKFGAFSMAFLEAMSPRGDLNKDGKITLGEIRTYVTRRTSELLVQAKSKNKQDSAIVWAGALTADTPIALTKTLALPVAAKFMPPKLPRGFGNPKWDLSVLESRFTIASGKFEGNVLVLTLELKDDLVLPLKCGLVCIDGDDVKIHTSRGETNPMIGKRGGQILLRFDVNQEATAKSVQLKVVAE